MKIKVQLRKLMNKDARSALKRVMEKWREAKEIYVFVKIAEVLDAEIKSYQDAAKILNDQLGYPLGAQKSTNVDAVVQHLYMTHGKANANGEFTLAGASESAVTEFLDEKAKFEAILREYNEQLDEMLDQEKELDIPRKIKVKESDIKKEHINAQECYLLEPFLDLSEVGSTKQTDKKEGDDD